MTDRRKEQQVDQPLEGSVTVLVEQQSPHLVAKTQRLPPVVRGDQFDHGFERGLRQKAFIKDTQRHRERQAHAGRREAGEAGETVRVQRTTAANPSWWLRLQENTIAPPHEDTWNQRVVTHAGYGVASGEAQQQLLLQCKDSRSLATGDLKRAERCQSIVSC